MRTARDIFLTILFLPLLLVFLLLTFIKFQILKPNFLPRILERNNVYPKLEEISKKEIEDYTLAEGGTKWEARNLSKEFSAANLKDFLDKNLKSIVNFANGVGEELKVYIPLKSIPKDLFPKNLKLSEEMNFSDISGLKINWIGNIGFIISVLWYIFLAILIIIIFSSSWITPVIGGVFTFLIIVIGNVAKNNMPQTLLGTLAPPILTELFKLWTYFAVGLIAVGAVLFFLRRFTASRTQKSS